MWAYAALGTQICQLNSSGAPLQATFALLNWALRETVAQLAFGRTSLSTAGFLLTSYVLLLVLYLVSILVPSVWTALSLTGATAAVSDGRFAKACQKGCQRWVGMGGSDGVPVGGKRYTLIAWLSEI